MAFGQSAKTSDFVADVIADWARRKQPSLPKVKELLINLDNGPENSGRRTQFLRRMVDLADATGWRIHLVYYPIQRAKQDYHRQLHRESLVSSLTKKVLDQNTFARTAPNTFDLLKRPS